MKRSAVVRTKHIVSGAVLTLGIVSVAMSSYAQVPEFRHDQPDNRHPSDSIYQPDFPRLGMIYIGGDQTYPSTAWPIMAKFNVVVMGGGWETWGDNRAWTRGNVVDGVHAASKIGTKIFQYVDFESVEIEPASDIYPTYNATVQANNWWLYANGTSGPVVMSPDNSNFTVINQTHWSPRDPVTGYYPFQAAAKYSYDMFIAGTTAHPRNAAPNMDGIYLDNDWDAPDANGDWKRTDGVTDSDTDPVVDTEYRAGNADFAEETRRLGKLALGNNGNWPLASTATNPATDPQAIGPLYLKCNGGVDEAVLGASFSYETWAGFTVAMEHYTDLMEMVAEPKLEMFNQEGLTDTGSDPYDSTPYHALRYGFAWALMNNGYYAGETAADHIGPSYGTQVWFDEYDAGGIGQGYLGQPTKDWNGAVQTKARWNKGPLGVWAREFEGGIAIMNPKGNGPVTISLEELGGPIWKHFLGTEDPSTNDGRDVTESITLADRDGVILLRRHPLPREDQHPFPLKF